MLSFLASGGNAPTSGYLGAYNDRNYEVNEIPGIAVPADGTLHHFVVTAELNTSVEDTSLVVRVNGVDSALALTLQAGDTKALNDSETLDVDAGDVISVGFEIVGSTGRVRMLAVNCLYSTT